ncbi:MAG: helix-turn-helix domain-containing protein [Acetobacteraceae bacterium]|nr:helix-turn-helix domain-containing protein [Acetobacteraceae bacterium]
MDHIAGDSREALGLKRLRERAGLTVRALAHALGLPSSTYASYERYKKDHLPISLVPALRPALIGRGAPQIIETELLALAGLAPRHAVSGGGVPSATPSSSDAALMRRDRRTHALDTRSQIPAHL